MLKDVQQIRELIETKLGRLPPHDQSEYNRGRYEALKDMLAALSVREPA